MAHAAFVRSLAFDLVGNVHDAEEIAQETLLRALEAPPRILTSLKAWLAGVTRNVARMKWRSEGRRTHRETAAARPESMPSAADSAATVETLNRLTRAISDLEEPYRQTLLMRYYEQLMPAEIARRTDTPVKTVKTRLHRGLAQLREKLDERHGHRRTWVLLLTPFLPRPVPPAPPLAPVVSGAILMSLKTKLILAVTALVVLSGAIVWSLRDTDAPPPPDRTGELVETTAGSTPFEAGDGAGGDEAGGTGDVPPPTGPAVTGTVTSAADGSPLENARVAWFRPAKPRAGRPTAGGETTTKADGTFRLPVPAGETVGVAAVAPGYETRQENGVLVPVDGSTEVSFALEKFPCAVQVEVIDGSTDRRLPDVLVYMQNIENDHNDDLEDEEDAAQWINVVLRDYGTAIGAFSDAEGRAALYSRAGPFLVFVREPGYRDFCGKGFVLNHGDEKRIVVRLEPYAKDERELEFGGVVTDGHTTSPLPGVTVHCRYRSGRGFETIRARTGKDGRYSLRTPANAYVHLRYGKEGYEERRIALNPIQYEERTQNTWLLKVGGGPRRGHARITGRVVAAETGEPVPGARLSLERVIGGWSGWTTDEEGRYRIDVGPKRGKDEQLILIARHPDFESFRSEPITIGPDRTIDFDVTLSPPDRENVWRGVVVDARTGSGIEGATVETRDPFDNPAARTRTDGAGRFLLPVRGNEETIEVSADGFVDLTVELDESPGDSPVRCEMSRTDRRITGFVRDAESGKAIAGARVSLFIEPEWSGPEKFSVTDESGAWSFPVGAGRFLIRATAEGYGPACGKPIDATAATVEPAQITLRAVDCVVSGVVREAGTGRELTQEYGEVWFRALPDEGEPDRAFEMVYFDSGGPDVEVEGASYRCRLSAGRYEIYAGRNGYEPLERIITLSPGDQLSLDLNLVPLPPATATIRGVLTQKESGEPVAKRQVFFEFRGHHLLGVWTDGSGRFEAKVPAGEIRVHCPGTKASKTVATKSGEAAEVELVIAD